MNKEDFTVDYPFVRAWGLWIGWTESYTEIEVEEARRARAPWNAIYYNEFRHRWLTVDDLRHYGTELGLKQLARKFTHSQLCAYEFATQMLKEV